MKVNFDIDKKTEVEFLGEEFEPEIVIRTSEGLLVEIFGEKEELKDFAKKLYQATNK